MKRGGFHQFVLRTTLSPGKILALMNIYHPTAPDNMLLDRNSTTFKTRKKFIPSLLLLRLCIYHRGQDIKHSLVPIPRHLGDVHPAH